MALYDGFFDAVQDEESGEYDRSYGPADFTGYFGQIIGSGVCIHNNPDSFKVRLEGGAAVISPGYLFIQGYWLKNDADYTVPLTGTGTIAILAHLNMGQRLIEIEPRSVAQAYPDSLVLALVNTEAGTVDDTRYNTAICGVIDTAGTLSGMAYNAIHYIDNEVEAKLAQAEADIAAQSVRLDAKIAEVQAVAERIAPPPVGSIKFSASQDVGEEWLPCDGRFVSETDYPELVAALGKLTPSGDKFQLISDGEIGPQISNGVVYGGRIWVYSYSAKKLYGVDLEGEEPVKEITLTSEDSDFNNFVTPSNNSPIALSICPSLTDGNAKIFLAQVFGSGQFGIHKSEENNTSSGIFGLFSIYCGTFSVSTDNIAMQKPFSNLISVPDINQNSTTICVNNKTCVPYVTSSVSDGKEIYRMMICGQQNSLAQGFFFAFDLQSDVATAYILYSYNSGATHYEADLNTQRLAYTKKNRGEAVLVSNAYYSGNYGSVSNSIGIISSPSGLFDRGFAEYKKFEGVSVPGPINIAGYDKVLFEYTISAVCSIPVSTLAAAKDVEITGISIPKSARVFIDGTSYLWGKDIYLIFVGTGILFSRTLEEGSFGYLDTTAVLGTITQFGYLDYTEDEETLYILGQDTTNTVKVAKIVLNTLYDYANDGAWLPVIASDGIPAYIKAKNEEAAT